MCLAKAKPQLIIKKSLKMRRRLTARINLNKFWTDLEEVYNSRTGGATPTSTKLIMLPELQDTDIEEQNRINEELEKRSNKS